MPDDTFEERAELIRRDMAILRAELRLFLSPLERFVDRIVHRLTDGRVWRVTDEYAAIFDGIVVEGKARKVTR